MVYGTYIGTATYQSVRPFVRIRSPHPLSQASVSPPLDPRERGEQHSLADEGVGGPNSDDRTESLAPCILCGCVADPDLGSGAFLTPGSGFRDG